MTIYNIRFKGHLDPRWENLFAGFTITHCFTPDQQPVTETSGRIIDQSALYGLVSRLGGFGVDLISIQHQENSAAKKQG